MECVRQTLHFRYGYLYERSESYSAAAPDRCCTPRSIVYRRRRVRPRLRLLMEENGYEASNELPKWLQQDYHDLEDLYEDVLVRPHQNITKKEMRWANGVNKSVNKLLNLEKKA